MSKRIIIEENGIARPIRDFGEAISLLMRQGMNEKDVVEGQKQHTTWLRQQRERQERLKKLHETEQAERNRPLNKFLSAVRHFNTVPELLAQCEESFDLNNLKEIEKELATTAMPKHAREFAKSWLDRRIARLQSQAYSTTQPKSTLARIFGK